MLKERKIRKAMKVYMASLLYHNPFDSELLSIDEEELVNQIRLKMAEEILGNESPFNESDDIAIKYFDK